jgi:hypothetical protein
MVRQPARAMPPHLHAAARCHLPDDHRERVRPQRPDLQLRVREQHPAQRHHVLADAALLHLPAVGHQLCQELCWGQHVCG